MKRIISIVMMMFVTLSISVSPFGHIRPTFAEEDNTQIFVWGSDMFSQTTLTPTDWSGYSQVYGSTNGSHFFAKKVIDPDAINSGTNLYTSWGDNTHNQRDIPDELDQRHISKLIPASSFTLAIMDPTPVPEIVGDETLVGWGYAQRGELDIPADLTGVVDVAMTDGAVLALKFDGSLVIWGAFANEPAYNYTIPDGLTDVVAVAAGGLHFVALKADGTVVAWGDNRSYQTDVPDFHTNVVAITAYREYSLALLEDGSVYRWGNIDIDTDAFVSALRNVEEITTGPDYIMARKSDGTITAWSDNPALLKFLYTHAPTSINVTSMIAESYGYANQVIALTSDGILAFSGFQTIQQPLSDITKVAAGGGYSLALTSDKTVIGWGANYAGQVNIPDNLTNVIDIKAGTSHALALKSNGTVVAWGDNSSNKTNVPPGLNKVVAIATGYEHSLALKSNGTVVAWGNNRDGQSRVPTNLSNVVAIAAGYNHSLALKSNGTVVAWGRNREDVTTVPANLSNVVAIEAGPWYSLALKSNGTIVAWGIGKPSMPAGLTNIVAISATSEHVVALKSNGTIVAWGDNSMGQISIPADLSGNVEGISAGSSHTMVLTGPKRITIPTLPTQLVRNPSFEAGPQPGRQGWSEFSNRGSAMILNIPVRAKTGDWLAMLGNAPNENMSLAQTINVPKQKNTLTFFYKVESRESCGLFNDSARVMVGDIELWKIDACSFQVSNTWRKVTINLKPYANRQIHLAFNMRTNATNNSTWFIEDINWQ